LAVISKHLIKPLDVQQQVLVTQNWPPLTSRSSQNRPKIVHSLPSPFTSAPRCHYPSSLEPFPSQPPPLPGQSNHLRYESPSSGSLELPESSWLDGSESESSYKLSSRGKRKSSFRIRPIYSQPHFLKTAVAEKRIK